MDTGWIVLSCPLLWAPALEDHERSSAGSSALLEQPLSFSQHSYLQQLLGLPEATLGVADNGEFLKAGPCWVLSSGRLLLPPASA